MPVHVHAVHVHAVYVHVHAVLCPCPCCFLCPCRSAYCFHADGHAVCVHVHAVFTSKCMLFLCSCACCLCPCACCFHAHVHAVHIRVMLCYVHVRADDIRATLWWPDFCPSPLWPSRLLIASNTFDSNQYLALLYRNYSYYSCRESCPGGVLCVGLLQHYRLDPGLVGFGETWEHYPCCSLLYKCLACCTIHSLLYKYIYRLLYNYKRKTVVLPGLHEKQKQNRHPTCFFSAPYREVY